MPSECCFCEDVSPAVQRLKQSKRNVSYWLARKIKSSIETWLQSSTVFCYAAPCPLSQACDLEKKSRTGRKNNLKPFQRAHMSAVKILQLNSVLCIDFVYLLQNSLMTEWGLAYHSTHNRSLCRQVSLSRQWAALVMTNKNKGTKLDSLCRCSHRRSRTPHFWGCVPKRGLWPQIWTRPRCLYSAPNPQVSSSCVYLFENYRVDKHTNKQTDAVENIQRSSLRYDVG